MNKNTMIRNIEKVKRSKAKYKRIMKTLAASSSTAPGKAALDKGLIWTEEQLREENLSFQQRKTTFNQEHIESLAAEREKFMTTHQTLKDHLDLEKDTLIYHVQRVTIAEDKIRELTEARAGEATAKKEAEEANEMIDLIWKKLQGAAT